MEDNLANQAVKATKWALITQLASKLINPITTVVLAHLLAPEVFGVIASLTMVISMADLITDAGFQKYIVQHEYEDNSALNRSADVAFWTNLALSAIFILIIFLARNQLASLVGCPGKGNVLSVASVSLLLSSFVSVQTAMYQRALDFKMLLSSKILSSVVYFIVSVLLAVVGLNYWSIVIGNIAGTAATAVLLTVQSSWKPGLFYSFHHLTEMISFSVWTLLESFLIWLSAWAGTFILGRVMESTVLGLYNTSVSMISAATAIITSAVMPVAFSAFSRLQCDKAATASAFYRVHSLLSLVMIPFGVGLFLFREPLVTVLLGEQWAECSLFFGLYGLSSAFKIVFSNLNSELFRSLGQPKVSSLIQAISLCARIPLLYFGAQKGFLIFSIIAPLADALIIPIMMIASRIKLNISIFVIFKNSLIPTAATMVAALFVFVGHKIIGEDIFANMIFAVLYIFLYILLLIANRRTRPQLQYLVSKLITK